MAAVEGVRSIRATFRRLRRLVDLTNDELGERLLDAAARGVMRCMDAQEAPDGSRWPALSEAYAAWKEKHHPGKPMAVLFELMKRDAEVKGRREVTAAEAVMRFGITPEAIAEGAWFEDGNEGQNRPPRPFYGLSAEAVERVDKVLKRAMDRALKG